MKNTTIYNSNVQEYDEITLHTEDGPFQWMVDISLSGHRSNVASLHAHAYYELFYVAEGRMRLVRSDDTIYLEKNTLLVIPPDTLHYSWSSDPKLQRFRLFFQPPHLPADSAFASCFSTVTPIVFTDPAAMQDAFFRLIRYAKRASAVRSSLMAACFQEILYLLKDELLQRNGCAPPSELPARTGMTPAKEYRKYMIDLYIGKNIGRHITLQDLAQETYMSERQISRILKKTYGQTFRERIIFLRMQNGAKLLLESDRTVQEIAKMVGYTAPHGFQYSFRNMFGMTPAQYRRAHRISDENSSV